MPEIYYNKRRRGTAGKQSRAPANPYWGNLDDDEPLFNESSKKKSKPQNEPTPEEENALYEKEDSKQQDQGIQSQRSIPTATKSIRSRRRKRDEATTSSPATPNLQDALKQLPMLESLLTGIHASLKGSPTTNATTTHMASMASSIAPQQDVKEESSSFAQSCFGSLTKQIQSATTQVHQSLETKHEKIIDSLKNMDHASKQLAEKQATITSQQEQILELRLLLEKKESELKERTSQVAQLQKSMESSKLAYQRRIAEVQNEPLSPRSLEWYKKSPPRNKKSPPIAEASIKSEGSSAVNPVNISSSRRRRSKDRKRRNLADYIPTSFDSLANETLLRSPASNKDTPVITIDSP